MRHGGCLGPRVIVASRASVVDLGSPAFDLCAEPELRAPVTKLSDRARHIRISMLVDADGVAMGKAEQFCDTVGVKQVVYIYLASHAGEITTGIRSVRALR